MKITWRKKQVRIFESETKKRAKSGIREQKKETSREERNKKYFSEL